MKKKLYGFLTFALIAAALIFSLVSCEAAPEDIVEEAGIIVTPIFKHIYTDINFKGDEADATSIYAYLQLGQVLAFIDDFSLSSPFDILVPHQGSDVIRLESGKNDDYGNYFGYVSPTQYTEGASGLNFSFATGSTVDPSTWDHGLTWDSTSRTLTWNAAGNASYYFIRFTNPLVTYYLLAAIEGTSLTVPAAIDLTALLNIGIYPYWSEEGFIEYVMPCAMA